MLGGMLGTADGVILGTKLMEGKRDGSVLGCFEILGEKLVLGTDDGWALRLGCEDKLGARDGPIEGCWDGAALGISEGRELGKALGKLLG